MLRWLDVQREAAADGDNVNAVENRAAKDPPQVWLFAIGGLTAAMPPLPLLLRTPPSAK